MVTKKIKIFLAIVAATMQTACDKNKDTAQSKAPVEIKVSYPADYFAVVPEVKQPEPIVIYKEVEKKAEHLAEEKVKKLLEERQKKEKEQEKIEQQKNIKRQEDEKQSYQNYLLTRSNLIRTMRRQAGATIISSRTNTDKSVSQKVVPEEYISSETTYHALNITSGYPVDRSFILTEDRTVPAILLDSINSQIAGNVRAMVAEDVFGADGRYKLLEKGDVIIGKYVETQKVGETRLAVEFYRIIRAADGAEIYSSGESFAYAADKMGRTGLVGDVDNRNWERYGLAFGTAIVGGLTGLGKKKSENDDYEEFYDRIADSTTEITSKVLEQYMNIAPVITIAQGEPFVLRLKTDITLKAPMTKKQIEREIKKEK